MQQISHIQRSRLVLSWPCVRSHVPCFSTWHFSSSLFQRSFNPLKPLLVRSYTSKTLVEMAAWRSGSLSRSLLATARSSSLRSSSPLPRVRPPTIAAPRPPRRRLSLHPRSVVHPPQIKIFLGLVASIQVLVSSSPFSSKTPSGV